MTKLGKYEILEEVGRGAFATVYKARDNTLDRIIALKVLHHHVADDPTFIQRFYQEARTAARLRHPNIATVYEVGEEAGQHYLAMTFLPGQTLDAMLTRELLPLEQTVSIVEQVAGALEYIHSCRLVHRDVKPSNIIVDDAGQATLLDFGIVRAADGTQLTTTGAVMGTPQYMSPEQAEGKEIDHRSDIYSLGVVAYQMCTGRAPFDHVSPLVVLRLHADKSPPSPRELNPRLPVEVEQLLVKALAKKRGERYQSAGEMARALREAVEAEEEARQQEQRLGEVYGQLREAVEGQDWATAEMQCHEILALEPGYQDMPEIWAQVQEARAWQRRLEGLYQQAQAKVESEAWAEAKRLCRRIESIKPGYRDVNVLAQRAAEGEAQAKQAQRVAEWREKALRAEQQGQSNAARIAVRRWLEVAPEDTEAHLLLERVAEQHMPEDVSPPQLWLGKIQLPRQRVANWALWSSWVLASAVGRGVGSYLVVELLPERFVALVNATSFTVVSAVWEAGVGAVVGVAQWVVLRRRIRRAGWWVLASTVGWAVFGIGYAMVFASDRGGFLFGGFGVAVGVAQWLVLRGQIERAGWWVLVSTLVITAHKTVWLLFGVGYWWHHEAALGTVSGMLTGLALVWLLKERISSPS
jgi:tRNA A-37 threonylcarbamoyl transferase component Bud32